MVHKANYSLGKDARNTRLDGLLTWIDMHADKMLRDPSKGIEAIGVGKKNADSVQGADDGWSLIAFVKKKLPEKTLAKENMSAFASAATSASAEEVEEGLGALAEHEMDVVECGSAFSASPGLTVPTAQRGSFGGPPPSVDFQKPFHAIRAGLGITNPVGSYPEGLSVGTLGFCVRDPNGTEYLVSNNHVIGRENSAQNGNSVVQPGTLDLTDTELQLMNTLNKLRNQLEIAKVSAVVDINLGFQPNEVDAAMAEFTDDSGRDLSQIARIGFGSRARGVAQPFTVDGSGNVVGDTRVYKAGRTTGWTEGNLTAIGVASNVSYTKGVALFRNQLAITPTDDNGGPFSQPGDSGSGIWNVDNNLVGLLFAGSTSRTLANPIDLVMSELEAELGVGTLTLIT